METNNQTVTYKNIGYCLTALMVFFILWLSTNLQAQQPSPQLIENKLKMAIKVSMSFSKEGIQLTKDLNQRLLENKQQLKQATLQLEQKNFKQADHIISIVIKDLIALRTQSKKNKQTSCISNINRLTKTARSLVKIIKISSSDIVAEKNIMENLESKIQLLKKSKQNEEKLCNELQLAIKQGITTIENRYSDNTTIVKLDLTTAKKRYLYDEKIFNTYKLLLQKRLDMSGLRNESRRKAANLFNDAYKIQQTALSNYKQNNFEQAETLQVKANSKLRKALRLSGLYISE